MKDSNWSLASFLIVLTLCLTTCTVLRDRSLAELERAKAEAGQHQ